MSVAHQQVEAQWEHEEKATKKMKAKKYVPSVSPRISEVLKLCTGDVDGLSEGDIEPFMEYDEDLPGKPEAEDRPVLQKAVDEKLEDAPKEVRQDADEKLDVELSPDGVTVERQDNSDLAAEHCGLGEDRPHL